MAWHSRLAAGFAVAVILTLGSCTVRDGELGRVVASDGGSISDGGSGGMSCDLPSPLVHVNGQLTCTGRLAATHFSNGLCSCGDVQLPSLSTRGFDSTMGPFQPNQPDDGGAAVGVNGTYTSTILVASIGGSFSVAGRTGLSFVGTFDIRGDFSAGGDVGVTGAGTIARNAYVGGSITTGAVAIGGDLHRGGTAPLTVVTAGTSHVEPVTVPKPCACEPSDLLDITGIVEAARSDNDNDRLQLPPDRYAGLAGPMPVTWNLSCGRVYLSGIGGNGALVVNVSGKSAVFVDGSITLNGTLTFNLAEGAEVDIFVRDNISASVDLRIITDRPSAGRLYVGGSQSIAFLLPWIGNLYAPRAAVSASAGVEFSGSIFVGSFSSPHASFVFDRSILKAGDNCSAPPPPAGSCTQCGVCYGGNACVSGSCGACATDSDCCSLSICGANGVCAPLLVQGPPPPAH